MPPFPPINKFKQWAAACDQLTMTKCEMTGASVGAIQWGKELMTVGTGAGHTQTDLVSAFGDESQQAQSASDYSCNAGTACYNGVWKAGGSPIMGCTRRSLCDYYARLDGGAGWSLLKGTAEPTAYCSPSASPSACGTNLFSDQYMALEVVPVPHEYIVNTPNPAGITETFIGNTIETIYPSTPHSFTPGTRWEVKTYFKVYAGTGFPDVLPYLRQGSTILGAWARMRLNTMTAYHYHASFDGGPEEDPPASGCWAWAVGGSDTYTSNCYIEQVTSALPIHVAALGQQNSGTIDILMDSAVDGGGSVLTDEYAWVEITGAVRAMFANLNGPYKNGGIHLFAYAGDTLHDLVAGQLDSQNLVKLRPKPSVFSCSLKSSGIIDSMAYTLDTYTLQYDDIDISDVYVSFELPASTVSTLLDYGSRPALA